ncbi:helix-turn-helix domain-containing protein [Kitasatospora fiedleri]|uniref:helix-turn-helix domain-containing protein n=1 Tax=Kitasatospora fiedleri TaxID=2991545 RepID=UPI00249CD7D0|nr:helix-turn-helix domain-containing protein [Kitasatospora fiedleri]
MTGTPDAIGALLGTGPRRVVPLPEPAERERLRVAYGLAKSETAQALGISASTLTAWEQGRRDPQGEGRAAYARLLEGIAAQLAAELPVETLPEREAQAEAGAVEQQAVMLDQRPDGSLVMADAAPCVQCGQPSVYRAQGRPMHLGGFCRPPVPGPCPPPSLYP